MSFEEHSSQTMQGGQTSDYSQLESYQQQLVASHLEVNTPPTDDSSNAGILAPTARLQLVAGHLGVSTPPTDDSPNARWSSPAHDRLYTGRLTKTYRQQRRSRKRKERQERCDQTDVVVLSLATSHMAEPIKDMESFVHRSIEQRRAEARKAGKIPRPMNSFMLYRSAYAERVKTWYAQNNHQVVSLAAGASWRNETEEIKDKYNALAKIEKQNHMKAHPGYKFAPSKDKRKRGILSDDRSFFSDTNSTPRGSPALSSFSSPEIGSSSSRFSNRSTPFDMADHGLPTDSYLASSWPRSNPATRPSSGMMLTSDPSLYHSAYYEYAGLGRQDMDELQYPSTALAGLPGAAHQDLLQGQPQMPAAELGQLDPQLLQYTSGPPHPDASDPYGSSQASVWDDAPENNYASPPAGPSSLPYAGPSSYHPEVQALADSQRWPLDASDSFDQFLNGNPPAY